MNTKETIKYKNSERKHLKYLKKVDNNKTFKAVTKNLGITLISLVVTIVVLLILARNNY